MHNIEEQSDKNSNLISVIKESKIDKTKERIVVDMIRNYSSGLNKEIYETSAILEQKISSFSKSEESNSMGENLAKIKIAAESANPRKYDFEPSLFGKIYYYIVNTTPLQRYITKFSSAKDVIKSVSNALDGNKSVLLYDNQKFQEEIDKFMAIVKELDAQSILLADLDSNIEGLIATTESGEYKKFLQESVLFELRKKSQDVISKTLVMKQAIASFALMIQTNNTHIDTINRVKDTTMVALSAGSMLTIGLQNQKDAINFVNLVNDVTNETIKTNAELMSSQSKTVQEQEVKGVLDINNLTKAIETTIQAINDYENYKVRALPEIKASILKLRSLNKEINAKISIEES